MTQTREEFSKRWLESGGLNEDNREKDLWEWIDQAISQAELRGAGKILDMLWTNSYYALGKLASDRIKEEMVYYFGKDWSTDMSKFIGRDGVIKTLKEINGKT